MKNIRIFIISSSVFLLAWLAASYTTHLDTTSGSHGTEFSAKAPAAQAPAVLPFDADVNTREKDMTTTASYAGVQ